MTTYGEFASLLQLGFGVRIGLSLFRAPINLRVSNLSRIIEGEQAALRGAASAFAKNKRRDLNDLKVDFIAVRGDLEGRQVPFMVVAVAGAFANLGGLVMATLKAQTPVGPVMSGILLFISIGWFVLILVALEWLARSKLSLIQTQLAAIQSSRAP